MEKIIRRYGPHSSYPGRIVTVERVDVCLVVIRIYADLKAMKDGRVESSYRYESTLEEAFAAL